MPDIPIGMKREETQEVTGQVAIDFLGLESARVLSTPNMVGFMERVCRNAVAPLLEAGFDTVGTHVNVSHVGAATIGAMVTFLAEVVAVNDRRIQFRVEARSGNDLIGEGTHERAVIHVARFASRLAARKA
jgi:predicted thioesterase